jgi:cardiolipin synthase
MDWLYIATPTLLLQLLLALSVTKHILLTKELPQSAIGWIGFVWTTPFIGSIFYCFFGINRVHRRALKLLDEQSTTDSNRGVVPDMDDALAMLTERGCEELLPLATAGAALTKLRLVPGNLVEHLHDGDEAYPAMLDAIASAQNYVLLQSYIFNYDEIGKLFTQTLCAAQDRGVEVRVLIDGMGELNQFPRTGWRLRRHGLRVARFIPITWLLPPLRINLRNHRKLLIVDGRTAFTGGVNISDGHWGDKSAALHDGKVPELKVNDIHYRITGPVVYQLQKSFASDWGFSSKAPLEVTLSEATQTAVGKTLCRTVIDMPVKHSSTLLRLYVAAIGAARQQVRIVTPYFLPPPEISSALVDAALRGVQVNVVLPSNNNHKTVEWASLRFLDELIQAGVKVWKQPPPFAHTKLLLIDDHYGLVGSCNLDPRSLSLNFEMNVEIFDADATKPLIDMFDSRLQASKAMQGSDSLGLAGQLRSGFFWLFSPYM